MFAHSYAAVLVPLALLSACGETLEVPKPETSTEVSEPAAAFGKLSLALETESGAMYRLSNAHFEIEGPTPAELETETGDVSKSLSLELETGSYSITLLPGWVLSDASGAPVKASVRSNRLPFIISADTTTPLEFTFEVEAPPVVASGTLSVSIAVSTRPSQLVIFSELMVNPAAVSDSAGEWIELSNPGTDDVVLTGCTLERDTSTVTLTASAVVPAGGCLTLANGASPGFVPGVVYSSVSLPNSAEFTLSLKCAGETLDSINILPSQWPLVSGKSLSLSTDAMDPSANDNAENWCLGATPYATDLGTPGTLNPACP